jgi:hypothetical protein
VARPSFGTADASLAVVLVVATELRGETFDYAAEDDLVNRIAR